MAACCLGMCAISFAVTGGPICLTSLAADLKMGRPEQGVFLGMPCWGLTVAILLVGPLADRLGVRALMAVGAAMQIAGLVLVSQAGSVWTAYAGGTLIGGGCGVADALLSPIVCAIYPERRMRMSGLLHSFYAIGLVATVLILLAVLAADWSWRSAFPLLAVLIVPYGLLVLVLPLPAQAHEGAQRLPARQIVRRGAFWLLVGAIFMSGVTELGPGGWLPAFVQKAAEDSRAAAARGQPSPWAEAAQDSRIADPPGQATAAEKTVHDSRLAGALGLLAFGVTMAVGRLTVSAVIYRLGVRRLFLVGGALCAMSLMMASLPVGSIWSAGWLALLGLGVAGFWPTIIATAGDRFPRAGASMFSLLSAAGNLGGVVGPVAIGLVADHSGLHIAMRVMALVPVATLVLIWSGVPRGHTVGRLGN